MERPALLWPPGQRGSIGDGDPAMKAPSIKPVRCAIYTRVSTEHGLDQEFNSLDAQYEAASAYIKSQAHAGWTMIRSRYDDGGYSGGSTDRPDLQKLLGDTKVGVYSHRLNARARLHVYPFHPRRPGCDSEYPRLQTLPNSFKILREYRLSVVALVFSR